jgi:hypothetical protein
MIDQAGSLISVYQSASSRRCQDEQPLQLFCVFMHDADTLVPTGKLRCRVMKRIRAVGTFPLGVVSRTKISSRGRLCSGGLVGVWILQPSKGMKALHSRFVVGIMSLIRCK